MKSLCLKIPDFPLSFINLLLFEDIKSSDKENNVEEKIGNKPGFTGLMADGKTELF